MINAADIQHEVKTQAERGTGSESKKTNVKLLVSKTINKVLYIECGKEFADLLFSFLAFPLGLLREHRHGKFR